MGIKKLKKDIERFRKIDKTIGNKNPSHVSRKDYEFWKFYPIEISSAKLEGYELAEKDILKEIPTTWLHPTLSGLVLRQRFSPKDIQDLLLRIRKNITSNSSTASSGGKNE